MESSTSTLDSFFSIYTTLLQVIGIYSEVPLTISPTSYLPYLINDLIIIIPAPYLADSDSFSITLHDLASLSGIKMVPSAEGEYIEITYYIDKI